MGELLTTSIGSSDSMSPTPPPSLPYPSSFFQHFKDQRNTLESVRMVRHAPNSSLGTAGKRQTRCEPTPETANKNCSTKVVLAYRIPHETTAAAPATCSRFKACEHLCECTSLPTQNHNMPLPRNPPGSCHHILQLWRTHTIREKRINIEIRSCGLFWKSTEQTFV